MPRASEKAALAERCRVPALQEQSSLVLSHVQKIRMLAVSLSVHGDGRVGLSRLAPAARKVVSRHAFDLRVPQGNLRESDQTNAQGELQDRVVSLSQNTRRYERSAAHEADGHGRSR